MFIDQSPSVQTPPPAPLEPAPKKALLERKELLLVLGLALIVVLGAGGWWYYSNFLSSGAEPEPIVEETPAPEGLPGSLPGEEENGGNSEENPDLKGENVTFGDFYKPLNEPLDIKAPAVGLPLNVKSDVSNYYDTARKINIDPIIDNLNNSGFAVLESPFPKSEQDFFGMYNELNQRSVPIVVTSDFLLYYYQNSLKGIYKEIESSFFYESLWRITKELYDSANGRYQERRQKVGVANDPLLEAQRLEAAFFAAGLMLLQPETEQINATEDINNSRKFKPSEASRFDFAPPGYLTDDLGREIQLIREGRQSVKSPVLLYQRDYTDFRVPSEYANNAKLYNFYLASRWYTSLFPLYFRDGACGNCLLDREDWVINQTAAHLVAHDLSESQALKNEWAKIYKVISFFSGLRSELTYLHYDNVRKEIFADASLEEVFGDSSFDRLIQLRDKLATLQFSEAEGAYSRQNPAERPYLGMRLLQTPYWPSRSFYRELTYDRVGNHRQPRLATGQRATYLSGCEERDTLYRCRGIGFDVLNPIIERSPSSKFLRDNMNYERYDAQVSALKGKLGSFTQATWHSNNFWTTLSLARALVNESFTSLPYHTTERWFERKLTTALASLTNLLLPGDTWQIARERQSGGLETSGSGATFNYFEPNLALADELVADTTMLFSALASLEVVRDNDVRFSDLLTKMSASRTIIRKELAGEALSGDDYQFMADLVSQYKTETLGNKVATIDFVDPASNKRLSLRQTISPLKLVFMIYEKEGRKILAAGPVFSYKEQ